MGCLALVLSARAAFAGEPAPDASKTDMDAKPAGAELAGPKAAEVAPGDAKADPAKPSEAKAAGAKAADAKAAPPAEEDIPKRVEKPASDGFLDRFVLESGRVTPLPLDPDFLVFSLHGEYELRFRLQTDLPLEPPVRGAYETGDGTEPKNPALLGQNAYLYHWLRLGGRIVFRDDIIGVAQIDLPRGLVAGETTQFVGAARDALNDYNWYDIHPRELYVEFRSPIGLFRVGQQTGWWGQGLVANDGNHAQMFGDTQRGALTERLLYATTPMGQGTPLTVAIAGDFVFQDNTAELLANSLYDEDPGAIGDLAGQAVAAVSWREDWADLGVYGVYRHQQRERVSRVTPYDETLDVGVVDVAGRVRGKVPGADAYAYAQGEAALIGGRTSYLRSAVVDQIEPTPEIDDESILSWGGALTLGFVHTRTSEKDRWGDAVAELEFGYASGDADPYDGVTHRFTFDTSHNVGLILFGQVLGWKTARSATIAQDPRVVARANPGLQFLPSNGGVFGATYLNPRVLLRPLRMVDVKLGMVWAQATSDVVDPYHVGALGDYRNWDGGDPTRRDLGVEIDSGVDVRVPVERTVTLEAGLEGGVFFAGHAFDDARGTSLPEQLYLNTKLGLQF